MAANSQLDVEAATSGYALTDSRLNPATLAYDRAHVSSVEECCFSMDRTTGLLIVRDGAHVFFQGNAMQQVALSGGTPDARWASLMALLQV